MQISLIGSGRVAQHLAQVLALQHQIVNIYARDLLQAQHLAAQVNATAVSVYADLQPVALCIIAVSDQAIANVAAQVSAVLPDCLLLHTSGSTALDIFPETHLRRGVLYPLQTFSFESQIDWKKTPLLIETNHADDLPRLKNLATTLSERVYCYDSAQRLSLHLAAVFACNFSNYCYDMAAQIVTAQQVDFNLLYPLMLETAKKATQHAPQQVQTGPAKRGDQNILALHQSLLQQQPDLAEVYQLMSQQIMQRHVD